MSAVKKSMDENSTGEFILPESFRKKAEELKVQNKNLSAQIELVKNEQTERKEDETTKLYNFRQQQLSDKIKELEEKKLKTERELALINQKKNSALHQDLKKATELLVLEAKKIIPLEKEIESGVSKITNIKNEIQLLFENSIEERKKTGDAINDQGKQISELGERLKETMLLMQNQQKNLESHLLILSEEIIDLNHKKSDLTIQNLTLKEENHQLEKLNNEIGIKKQECNKLDHEILIKKERINEYQENIAKQSSIATEIEDLKRKKTEVELEVHNQLLKKEEIFQQIMRANYEFKDLEEQLSNRKTIISQINIEIMGTKKDLEKIRTEQFELLKSYGKHQENLNQIQNEISKSEAQKISSLKLQDEALNLYQDKKTYYQREIALLEENYQKKFIALKHEFENKELKHELDFKNFCTEMKAKEEEFKLNFEQKKQQWESEFKEYCEQKQADFNQSIEQINSQDLEKIKAIKKELIAEVISSFKAQLTRPGFSSTEEKIEDVKKEISQIFDKFYGKTTRWKW